jgi:2'-hydroxyisoflavone reductase
MRILIVGGTSFVGRGVAWAALNAGHDVTVINRGQTPSDLPESVTRLIGDRHGDMSALAGLSFDVTVDAIAFRPVDVDVLAAALGDRGGHHIQISSVSAYEDPPSEGATEENAVLWNDTTLAPDAEVTGRVLRAAQGRLRTLRPRTALRRSTLDRSTDLRHRQPRRHPSFPLLGRSGCVEAATYRGARTARQRAPVHRRPRPR